MEKFNNREIIEMYRKISKSLFDPSMKTRLRELFSHQLTLRELLEWLHRKIEFDKSISVRHNDPFEIIQYGRGMCREFSVLYNAICLANGYRARLVLDMSDHVWVEVWEKKSRRWLHVDPSEKRIDDPKMYERDWKKDLKEVYAFENGKLEDVAKNYKIDDQC
jgi:hypothetical protein